MYHGLFVIDKPTGMTSRSVVNQVQTWFPRRTKVGHCGTLDPLATGVLVICIGHATRLTPYVQDLPKTYQATFRLGAFSDTDDADGTITPVTHAVLPDLAQIEAILATMVGQLDQVPPTFSAARIDGKRAYELARRGKEVALTSRTIQIDQIQILGWHPPELELQIDCGKGTYIRSIARDLGEQLTCGSYVSVLRRLRIGSFTPDLAIALETEWKSAREQMLPIHLALAHLPRLDFNAEESHRLQLGQQVQRTTEIQGQASAFDSEENVLGVVEVLPNGLVQPTKILQGIH